MDIRIKQQSEASITFELGIDQQDGTFTKESEAFIKWDACSHWWDEPPPSDPHRERDYLHMCGLDEHIATLLRLYKLACRKFDKPHHRDMWDTGAIDRAYADLKGSNDV